MRLEGEERAILAGIARQLGVATQALVDAVEHESTTELAAVMGITRDEAAARLEPVRRTVTVGDDWGAGCKLLTDEMRAELRVALRKLLPTPNHSVSSGVSQG